MSNITGIPDLVNDAGATIIDVTNNLIANAPRRQEVQQLTESGAMTAGTEVLLLSHATVIIAATLPAPVAGDKLAIINNSASGTVAHTATCAGGVTFDGTNNTATIDAPDDMLDLIAISATRYYIKTNNGSVALSSV